MLDEFTLSAAARERADDAQMDGLAQGMVRPLIGGTADLHHAATSSNTSGWRSAIFSSVCAAPDGSRRPCSHCSKVRLETPSAAATHVALSGDALACRPA